MDDNRHGTGRSTRSPVRHGASSQLEMNGLKFSTTVEREIMEISRNKDYSRRFRLTGDAQRDNLVKALNVLLSEVESRESELKRRLDELVDARDDAQTSNLLLQRVKRELQARSKELDDACAKSKAANTAKSQFLANMSHEIRTPMNGILGMAELLARTPLETKQQKLVSTIVQSGRALLTIINDILDFSKIESGKIDIELKPFDFRTCVEDVVALLGPAAERKQIGLRASIAPNVPDWYVGDVGRLRQILTNIIGNAVKFTDKGDVFVSVAGEPQGEMFALKIGIKDSGIGIPPEKLDEVFDKFSQVDNTSTRRHEGTGLGLAICRLLARRMGGDVTAVSTIGEGSTFTFSIALAPHSPEPVAKSNETEDVSGARIFLIEDMHAPQGSVRRDLAALGCAVNPSTSWQDARLQLGSTPKEKCDVIIFDVDSITPSFERQIYELHDALGPTNTPPIIIVTGIGAPGDGPALTAAGVRAYLTRPMLRGELPATIRLVLSGDPAVAGKLITRHTISEMRRANVPASAVSANAATAAGEPALAPAAAALPSERRVLLVEDSKVNQEVAREFLEDIACTITIANNGQEAVDAIANAAFDVVLMDCQMPVMDGFEATRLIRLREAETKSPRIPIIALTANAFASDKEKCLASGMSDFLSKPFMPGEFEDIVQKWLDNPSGT